MEKQNVIFENNNYDLLLIKLQGYIKDLKLDIDPNIIKELFNLCLSLTKDYDESHDITHHICVVENAFFILVDFELNKSIHENYSKIIISKKEYNRLMLLILYVAMLHDTVDHKYPTNLEFNRKIMNDFLEKYIPEFKNDILWIINNISYSTEVKYGYPINSDPILQLARDIISDADKIESIGNIGISRCYQYIIASNPTLTFNEITKLVVQHCHDKLLKIKDNFIRTKPGLVLAESEHEIIANFVKNYE